ncbi:hypothetical protein EBZ39_18580 [bacterium]|nr:hypothetical protein [bacterium]
MNQAAANSAAAAGRAIFGGEAENAERGPAGRAVQAARNRLNDPEAKAQRERERQQKEADAKAAREAAAADAKEEQTAAQDAKDEAARQKAKTKAADDFFNASAGAAAGPGGQQAIKEYKDGLMALDAQLERGAINEETYAREAEKLKKGFGIAMKAADKQAEIDKMDAERASALEGKSNEALKANDLRSSEGIAQFLALANGREDPAIEENRKQTKKLDEIRKEIAKLQAEKVEILGAAA